MGLFSKLKKIGKKVAGATIGKALKHDPIGKKLLKKDPLGRKLLSHATMGGTDAALGMGGKKGGSGAVGKLAQAMMARKMGNAGVVSPQAAGMSAGPVPMARPAVVPTLPPEMGGGMDPMYANLDPATGLSMGGPPMMSAEGVPPPITGGAPMTGGPAPVDQLGGGSFTASGPAMSAEGMAPRPPMAGPPRPMGPVGQPNGMRGGMLRRRLALGGGMQQ